jgi:hypothetical protein
MATVPGSPKRGYRTIRLPLAKESYAHFLSDGSYCRRQLDGLYRQHPELFPEGWEAGYVLCGKTPRSRKQGIRCQRVRLVAGAVGYTVAPTFVTPYLAGRTAEVEKALFLMRFHGPCWALADVFGRDAMSWYRLEQALGRCSVVGTTVQAAERWAQDWVADEKHSRLAGDKISSATTAGDGGILGASVVDSACEEEPHRAYGVFAEEARDVAPDYQPETVNTDGWAATPGAWKRLFPNIAVILCFLHAFLKIRDRATQALSDYFEAISRRVWEAYRAQGKASFESVNNFV